jgi:N utilization substance protein A
VEDDEIQITLADAKKIRKDVTMGEKLLIDVTPKSLELSRIAAQSAAQTIKQSLKGIERERFYEKFQNKQ